MWLNEHVYIRTKNMNRIMIVLAHSKLRFVRMCSRRFHVWFSVIVDAIKLFICESQESSRSGTCNKAGNRSGDVDEELL